MYFVFVIIEIKRWGVFKNNWQLLFFNDWQKPNLFCSQILYYWLNNHHQKKVTQSLCFFINQKKKQRKKEGLFFCYTPMKKRKKRSYNFYLSSFICRSSYVYKCMIRTQKKRLWIKILSIKTTLFFVLFCLNFLDRAGSNNSSRSSNIKKTKNENNIAFLFLFICLLFCWVSLLYNN